jgi:hypothetical protein
MTIENVLEKRVTTDRCQWMENGKVFMIEELSREDLMQVAAQALALITRTENRVLTLCADLDSWNKGEPVALEPEPATGDHLWDLRA